MDLRKAESIPQQVNREAERKLAEAHPSANVTIPSVALNFSIQL